MSALLLHDDCPNTSAARGESGALKIAGTSASWEPRSDTIACDNLGKNANCRRMPTHRADSGLWSEAELGETLTRSPLQLSRLAYAMIPAPLW